MGTLVITAFTIVAIWLIARWVGRGKPCPTTVAALFDNRLAERLGRTATLIERADVREGMRVLDAGCGPGRLTIPLARRVGPRGEAVALDVQQGMLDRVVANAERAGLANIRTTLGALGSDGATLRDDRETFDRVLLVTVLGEIPDPLAALVSLNRALKPGGVLSITEMIVDPDYVSRRRVQELATRAGFEMDKQFGSPLMFTTNVRRPRSPLPDQRCK